MEEISKVIWDEKFWLPEGFTWKVMEPTPGVKKPQFSDLYFVPVFAVILVIIRYSFERFIATPFCKSIGITRNQRTSYEKNPICEHVFSTTSKKPNTQQVDGLAKQLGWPRGKVERWFHKRRKSLKLPLLTKATESCWRCIFYLWLFCFGAFTILPTDWFYDTTEWMRGYLTSQDFNIYLRAYYMMELSFYTSLLFSQFIDAKRKDFYQMFIHHIVTILLIFTSYAINQHRIGVVIMFLHDASDFWLEAAKVFNYAKWQKFCDGLFVMFAIAFFSTRWIFYPFWVLHCLYLKSPKIIGSWGALGYFMSLLSVLQFLHKSFQPTSETMPTIAAHLLSNVLYCLGVFSGYKSKFYRNLWLRARPQNPVLHAMIVLTVRIVGPFPSYYYFTTLLVILQILHIYWGALIVHMVYKLLSQGKVDRDTRSEDESSGDEGVSAGVAGNVQTKKKKI